MASYILKKSTRKDKKFMILMEDMNHHFGQKKFKDFTIYSKELNQEDAYKKKLAYIARHKKNEDWNKSGLHSSGFWARWILWNQPTIAESIKDIEKRFKIKIINKIK